MKKPQFNQGSGSGDGGEPKGLQDLSGTELTGILENMSNETVDNKKNPPDPKKPEPDKPVELLLEDPANPDPAKPDPAKPDPANPDPAKPDPANPDPAKPDNTLLLTDYSEIAKELELPEADKIATKESLVNAYKSKVAIIHEAERAKVINDMKALTDFSPEAQYYIHKVNTAPKDASFSDLVDPGSKFDKYIAMDNQELVAAHLRTAKVPEAQIPGQVEALAKAGQLEGMAEEIRESLKTAQTNIRNEETSARTKFVQERAAAVLKEEVDFSNKVVDNIMKTSTFEGFTVPEQTRKIIAARFQDPKSYRERLSKDPDFVAKLIVQNELMAITLKQIRDASKAAGAHEQKKLEHENHYNPDRIKKSGGGGAGAELDPENPFGSLVSKFQSGQDVTIV
jgi:cation transport regulator ChaC